MCAGILALWIGIFLGGATRSSAAPQLVPTKVVQPFQVVDSTGRVLFSVAMGSGGIGVVEVYDNKGRTRVSLGAEPGSPFGAIQVTEGSLRFVGANGSLRAAMGISAADDGVLLLKGKGGTGIAADGKGFLDLVNSQGKTVVSLSLKDPDWPHLATYDVNGNLQVTVGSPPAGTREGNVRVLGPDGGLKAGIGLSAQGEGLILVKGGKANTVAGLSGIGVLELGNAQGTKVVSLGVSGSGAGDFQLYNRSGTSVAGLSAEQGPGVLQLRNAGGQERVSLGTLTNGKGDVCASGVQGKNCLSRLDPRY